MDGNATLQLWSSHTDNHFSNKALCVCVRQQKKWLRHRVLCWILLYRALEGNWFIQATQHFSVWTCRVSHSQVIPLHFCGYADVNIIPFHSLRQQTDTEVTSDVPVISGVSRETRSPVYFSQCEFHRYIWAYEHIPYTFLWVYVRLFIVVFLFAFWN